MNLEFCNHILTVDEADPEFESWTKVLTELAEQQLILTTHLIKSAPSGDVDKYYITPEMKPDKLQFNTIYQAFCLIREGVLISLHFIDSRLAQNCNVQIFERFNHLYKHCVDKWNETHPLVTVFEEHEPYLMV